MAATVRLQRAAQESTSKQGQEGASLQGKIKNALDEARMLVLGSEVLVGAAFRTFFQPGFEKLPAALKGALAGATGLMLIVLMLLMLPGPYHEITEHGQDTKALREFVTRVAGLALAPFALSLGAIVAAVMEPTLGLKAAVGLAAGGVVTALVCWYGIELVARHLKPREREMGQNQDDEEEKPIPVNDKILQVLTEARVVLPGAQALLGFQFISMFSDSFSQLPESSKLVHVGSLAAVALCVVFLMTPPAYHRLVEDGEATEAFHRFASRMTLLAMAPLAFGLCGDFFVVLRKVTNAVPGSCVGAALMLTLFLGCWFGLTYALRRRHDRPKLALART